MRGSLFFSHTVNVSLNSAYIPTHRFKTSNSDNLLQTCTTNVAKGSDLELAAFYLKCYSMTKGTFLVQWWSSWPEFLYLGCWKFKFILGCLSILSYPELSSSSFSSSSSSSSFIIVTLQTWQKNKDQMEIFTVFKTHVNHYSFRHWAFVRLTQLPLSVPEFVTREIRS